MVQLSDSDIEEILERMRTDYNLRRQLERAIERTRLYEDLKRKVDQLESTLSTLESRLIDIESRR